MSSARASVLVGEAWRAVAARPIRFVVLSLIAGLVLASATALEAGAYQQVVSAQNQAEQAGAGVLVIDDDGAPLGGAGCATLAGMADVVAAGAVYDVRARHATRVPTALFQLATVSPGLIRVIDPHFGYRHAGPYVLGSDLPDVLGLAAGSRLEAEGETPGVVAGTLTGRMRATEQARWVFRIAVRPEAATIRECWVQVETNAAEAFTRLVPALFPDADDLRIRRLSSADSVQALVERFEQRPTKLAWAAAGGIVGVLSLFLSVFRRAEYALCAISGFRREELTVVAFTEQCAIIILATVFGAAAAFFLYALQYPVSAPALWAGGLTVALSVSLAVAISAIGALWVRSIDVARSLRNRD